jgi:hypothetical protein
LYEQSRPKDPTRFGAEFRVIRHGLRISPVWKAPAMTQVYAQLAANKKRASTSISICHGVCHFGHPLTKKTYRQDLVPMWRGAKLDAPLCQACHRIMTYEMNTHGMPFVTQPSTPPIYSAITAPTGPCYFGHTTSSAVHCQASGAKSGQPRWFRIPEDMQWGDVTSNDSLCQGCYHKYRKAASLQTPVAKPAPHNKRPRTGDISPAPSLALGGPRCEENHSQPSAVSFPPALDVRSGSNSARVVVSTTLCQASAASFPPALDVRSGLNSACVAGCNDGILAGKRPRRPSTPTRSTPKQRRTSDPICDILDDLPTPPTNNAGSKANIKKRPTKTSQASRPATKRTPLIRPIDPTTTFGKCGGDPEPLDIQSSGAHAQLNFAKYENDEPCGNVAADAINEAASTKYRIFVALEPVFAPPGDDDEEAAMRWAIAASKDDEKARRAKTSQSRCSATGVTAQIMCNTGIDANATSTNMTSSMLDTGVPESAMAELSQSRGVNGACGVAATGINEHPQDECIRQGDSTAVPRGTTTTVPAGGAFGATSRGRSLQALTQVSPACFSLQTVLSERSCVSTAP